MLERHHRLLKAFEEIDLAMRIEAGRDAATRIAAGDLDESLPALVADGLEARDMLFEHNLRLVHKMARKYYAPDAAVQYDDLVQDGCFGLLTAIEKFDWRLGNRFSTLATWWVFQAVTRSIENSGTIRGRANPEYYSEKSRQLMANARYVRSLDEPLLSPKGKEGRTLEDVLPAPHNVEDEALQNVLIDEMLNMPMTATMHAALSDVLQGYTLDEAGTRNGGSRGYVASIYPRLRRYLGIEEQPQ